MFEIPDFGARMSLIRSAIRPKLIALSKDLAPHLGRTPFEWYPHIASHMRRRINPPDETWAAFARSRRGYKKYAHLVAGISARGPFARLVIKRDGEDHPTLRQAVLNLKPVEYAVAAAKTEASEAGEKIAVYAGGSIVPLTAGNIAVVAGDPDHDFVIGREFSAGDAQDGEAFIRRVSDTFEAMMPFYTLGTGIRSAWAA